DDKKAALLSVSELFGSITDISRARDLVHNTRSAEALERLNKINDILKAYGVEQYVSFDLGLLSKYHYYTGIIFKAYSYGVGDAIVKGGRYDRLLHYFGKDAPAVGFAVVVDDVMEALDYQKTPVPDAHHYETVTYQDEESYDTALKEAVRLRREGKRVVLTREVKDEC
ncbi:MAG: ATP phosphoribosyltransferase regulatory subunit, partial [Lachnospiraceae bacterium]|nr:ATP phosphoribosyltransferase regulatory subunit [Lachnospiraceae bacterium]